MVLTHGAGGGRESPLLQRLCDEWARHGCLRSATTCRTGGDGPKARRQLGNKRSRRHSRGDQRVPPTGGRHGDRGRAFLRRPDDLDGGGGEGSPGRRADAVLLSGASTRQARTCPHRTSTRHRGADGIHPRHVGPVRVAGRGARCCAIRSPAPTQIVEIAGARHDLVSETLDAPGLAVAAALRLLGRA